MKRAFLSILFCLAVLLPASGANDDEPLYGFTAANSKVERDWENKFRAIPSPQILKDSMERLSKRPHHVGSPYDKDNAEWILSKFKSWGLDAQIETFDVLFPTPKERVVELLGPTHFVAKLQEPPVAVDPTSNQQDEQLPTYNAYSIDGDVTAPLVYVNYGIPRDYEVLDRLGVSVKGAIVIARYGQSWRGNTIIQVVIAGRGESLWERVQDATTPGTNTEAGRIQPTEYNASTSPYVLKRQAGY